MTEEPRATGWSVVSASPLIEVRELRPRIHRPLDCPEYDPVYRPMKVEYEGACNNFDHTRMYCVFCGACLMSHLLKGIPYDVRAHVDEVMGW